jgi:hypothetical protein
MAIMVVPVLDVLIGLISSANAVMIVLCWASVVV